MALPGEVIALLTTLCWSIGIFPFTEATRRMGALPVNQYRLLFAWLIITLILFIFFGLNFNELVYGPTFENYLWFGISGIIGFTLGDYFGFSSFAMVGPKLASLYTTIAPGVALIFGIFILDENINFIGVVGIFVTWIGVAWLTLSKRDNAIASEKGFDRNTKGIVFGILGAACQGIGLVLSKKAMLITDDDFVVNPMHATWLRLFSAWVGAFLFAIFTGRLIKFTIPILNNQKNGIPFMLLGTIFGPVMGVSLSLLAISKIPVAVAQTIFALLPIIVLPLNLIFYKEKITIHSVFACLVSMVGVFILIWREQLLSFING